MGQQMTRGKNRRPQEVCYNGLFVIPFAPVALDGPTSTADLPQGIFPLGVNCKIMAVAVAWSAGATTSYSLALQIAQGITASGGPAPPDNTLNGVVPPTVAQNGQTLFNAANGRGFMTGLTAGQTVLYPTEVTAPDQFDAIWSSQSALGLFLTAVAGAGAITVAVSVWATTYDINPPQPQNQAWYPSPTNL